MLCDRNAAADIHGSDYYSVVFRLHFRRQSRIAALPPPSRHANTMVIREGIQDARFNTTSLDPGRGSRGWIFSAGDYFCMISPPRPLRLPPMLDRITNRLYGPERQTPQEEGVTTYSQFQKKSYEVSFSPIIIFRQQARNCNMQELDMETL